MKQKNDIDSIIKRNRKIYDAIMKNAYIDPEFARSFEDFSCSKCFFCERCYLEFGLAFDYFNTGFDCLLEK